MCRFDTHVDFADWKSILIETDFSERELKFLAKLLDVVPHPVYEVQFALPDLLTQFADGGSADHFTQFLISDWVWMIGKRYSLLPLEWLSILGFRVFFFLKCSAMRALVCREEILTENHV